jgi:hypothetical protein
MGYPENQVYPISADTERDRIRAAAANRARPATASNPITKLIAGVTAMVRELSYPQMTPANSYFIKIPPFGTIILLLGYLGFILGLEFYNDWVDGAQHWEAFGLRAALLTVAQLPLLILLGGKTISSDFWSGYRTNVSRFFTDGSHALSFSPPLCIWPISFMAGGFTVWFP